MKHLTTLLQSLTSREKFYFRKTYSSSGEKNFFRLYDFLIKKPNVKLEEVKNHFGNDGIKRNIHYEINQLYQKVLRSLNIYRMSKPTPEIYILQLLQHIDILIEKQQLKQAWKLLLKAKKIAYEFEEFSILIKIIGIQEELEFTQIDSDIAKNIQKLEEERNSISAKIKEYNQLRLLKIKFVDFQFSVGLITTSPEKFPNLFESPLLSDVNEIKSKKSKDLWFFCKSMAFSLTGAYSYAKDVREERLFFMQNNKKLFSDYEEIIALNNYLFLMVQMKRPFDFQEKYTQLHAMSASKEVSKDTVLFFSYYLQLAMFITLKTENKIIQLFPDAFSFVKRKSEELNTTQTYYLFFYLTKALVTIHDYAKSIEVLNIWNQHRMEGIRFIRFKLLWLITHYCLGNFLLLNNELNNLKRTIRKKKINNNNLNLFIDFLKKATSEPTEQYNYLEELELAYFNHNKKVPDSYIRVYEINLAKWAEEYRSLLIEPNYKAGNRVDDREQ